MKKLFSIFIVLGTFSVVVAASPAKAETWWLVAASKEINKSAIQYFTLPMASESQCQAAGNKLVLSAAKGNLNDAWVDRIRFECIKGK